MATRIEPFDGRLDDASLRNVELVRSKLKEAVQAVDVRDGEIKRLASTADTLQKEVAQSNQLVLASREEVAGLQKELAVQVGRVQELKDRLDQVELKPPKIGVQDLVTQFKTDVDRINADVLSRKTTGMLVDSVEVEVRGGIDVTNGLHITQLPAAALGAQSVSVLKFNLRPTSALKIVEDDETR